MASRDNQTMQAIVIVLVLAVIGLGVGLILVNNSKKTAQASAKSANDSASSAQQSNRQAQEEANRYKEMMGFSEADAFDSLQNGFEEDMKNFGGTFDENNRFLPNDPTECVGRKSQAGLERSGSQRAGA